MCMPTDDLVLKTLSEAFKGDANIETIVMFTEIHHSVNGVDSVIEWLDAMRYVDIYSSLNTKNRWHKRVKLRMKGLFKVWRMGKNVF